MTTCNIANNLRLENNASTALGCTAGPQCSPTVLTAFGDVTSRVAAEVRIDNNNNNNNNYYYYLLQLGCHPVAVVILHVYKI